MTSAHRPSAITPCILVADADPDTRALYRQCLAFDGCDIVEACDGREALAKALTRPPVLVVTETQLPFVDGYALCDILRHDRTTAGVAIMVVTADARGVELDRARQAGADVVLVKPATPHAIVSEMRRLLSDGERECRSATIPAVAATSGKSAAPTERRKNSSGRL